MQEKQNLSRKKKSYVYNLSKEKIVGRHGWLELCVHQSLDLCRTLPAASTCAPPHNLRGGERGRKGNEK